MTMDVEIFNFHDVSGATHKEVGVDEIIDDAKKNDLEALCVISSGNFIWAIRDEINHRGLPLAAYNLSNKKPKDKLDIQIPAETLLITEQQRVNLTRESTGISGPIKDYTDFVPQTYQRYAKDILKSNPDYVICPIGSSKLWLSIVREIQAQQLNTRVVGVTPEGKNAFYHQTFELDSLADKLTAPFTSLKDRVISESPQHGVYEATEKKIKKSVAQAKKQQTECEPSGAVGFLVYQEEFRQEIGIEDDAKVTVVCTGTGHDYNLKRIRTAKKKMGIVGSCLMAAVVGLWTHFGTNQKTEFDWDGWAQTTIQKAQKRTYSSLALQFIADTKRVGLYDLDSNQVILAMQLYDMSSTALDYRMGSQDPKMKSLYNKFCRYILNKRTELGVRIDLPKTDA